MVARHCFKVFTIMHAKHSTHRHVKHFHMSSHVKECNVFEVQSHMMQVKPQQGRIEGSIPPYRDRVQWVTH